MIGLQWCTENVCCLHQADVPDQRLAKFSKTMYVFMDLSVCHFYVSVCFYIRSFLNAPLSKENKCADEATHAAVGTNHFTTLHFQTMQLWSERHANRGHLDETSTLKKLKDKSVMEHKREGFFLKRAR